MASSPSEWTPELVRTLAGGRVAPHPFVAHAAREAARAFDQFSQAVRQLSEADRLNRLSAGPEYPHGRPD